MICIRIRTHSAGVRPFIPVIRALVILHRRHMFERPAIAKTHQRELFAFELLFDDKRMPMLNELPAKRNAVLHGQQMIPANFDSLTAGEPIIFDHMPIRIAVQHFLEPIHRGEAPEKRVAGNLVLRQKISREAFA